MIRTRFLKRLVPHGIILIPLNPITPIQNITGLLELPTHNTITPIQNITGLLELPTHNTITPIQNIIGTITLLP